MASSHCVYCKDGDGSTRDHIPPKAFFGDPPPSNLITVPCCETCRMRDQQDDQFMRNLFVSLRETENHPTIASQVASRRNRSFVKDKTQVAKLAEIMTPVEVNSPGGLYLGTAPAFNLNDPRIDRFIERVSRGVIYDAFGISFFVATFRWKLNPPNADFLFQAGPPECRKKDVGEIFSYWIPPESQDRVFWTIMRFYRNLLVLSRFQRI